MNEELLNEGLGDHSIIKRTRDQKIQAAAAATAVQLAKQNGDPMYDKLKKYKTLMMEARHKIMQKWFQKAKIVVRQRLKTND